MPRQCPLSSVQTQSRHVLRCLSSRTHTSTTALRSWSPADACSDSTRKIRYDPCKPSSLMSMPAFAICMGSPPRHACRSTIAVAFLQHLLSLQLHIAASKGAEYRNVIGLPGGKNNADWWPLIEVCPHAVPLLCTCMRIDTHVPHTERSVCMRVYRRPMLRRVRCHF